MSLWYDNGVIMYQSGNCWKLPKWIGLFIAVNLYNF